MWQEGTSLSILIAGLLLAAAAGECLGTEAARQHFAQQQPRPLTCATPSCLRSSSLALLPPVPLVRLGRCVVRGVIGWAEPAARQGVMEWVILLAASHSSPSSNPASTSPRNSNVP